MNVVAVGSHPDDIEFNCAGALIKHVMQGDNVVIIIASDGATNNINNETIRSRKESINEAKKAADIIGAKLHILDYPTLDIPYNHKIVAEIESYLNQYKADIVYTHWHCHTNQDHFNLSRATLAAARCVDHVFMWEEGIPHEQCTHGFMPQLYIDITDEMPKKMESIRAHESQIKKYTTEILEAIESRARYRGYQIRKRYAECFAVKRMVGITPFTANRQQK